MEQEFDSGLLETAVTELSRLPGVGRKTALRLALHLLRQEKSAGIALGESLINLCTGIQYCDKCHNISEERLCPICADHMRDHQIVCVVESVKDVMAIENTRQYNGVYHVLGGLISPIDGVGPDQLQIDSLVKRVVDDGEIEEVIMALSATMEGETTGFYIYRRLEAANVKVTQLARGRAVGNDLEYTDEITLGRSLMGRTLFIESI